jgi:hypothetical protein
MRFKVPQFFLLALLFTTTPAFGQDLRQLKQRVSKLWELRQQEHKKTEALSFVEPQSKELFLSWDEPTIVDFKMAGFEPSDDDNRLDVIMNYHFSSPYGILERTVKETWLWIGNDWFLKVDPLRSPFLEPDKADSKPAALPPDFQFSSKTIDAGRHIQGELLEGRIPFRAKRNEIRLIRSLMSVPGLTLSQPTWTNSSEGYISYIWDTTLLTHDVRQSVPLDIVGVNDASTRAQVDFRVAIEGIVAFSQDPETIDPTEAGVVELEIKNLSKESFKFLSATSNNAAFHMVEERFTQTPDVIEPGQSGRIQIWYEARPRLVGASLDIMLSRTLRDSPIIRVPLRLQAPKPAAESPLITEEMKRLAEEEYKKGQAGRPGPK